MTDRAPDPTSDEPVGVGPHPAPWPDDPRLDPSLLAEGDRRNVLDRYRYWSVEAIVADLDPRRHAVHVAIENWEHDFNIGTVIRNANAFLVGGVHVIGRRHWDRRGAMSTHVYQHVHHHPDVAAFVRWCAEDDRPIVAIENTAEAESLERATLPERCVLVFGQEGPGMSSQLLAAAARVCAITQYGSTRSLNAGVASGIAMYAWATRHASPGPPGGDQQA